MVKIIDRFRNIDCCKNTLLVRKHCLELNICFSSNHPYGKASIETFLTGDEEFQEGYTYSIPVYIGYYDGDRYLSYSPDEFRPVRSNRYYEAVLGEVTYRYAIQVNNNGKIVNIITD